MTLFLFSHSANFKSDSCFGMDARIAPSDAAPMAKECPDPNLVEKVKLQADIMGLACQLACETKSSADCFILDSTVLQGQSVPHQIFLLRQHLEQLQRIVSDQRPKITNRQHDESQKLSQNSVSDSSKDSGEMH